MEQTKEAIEHARAAGVPIVVAINKVDKPNANPERVKSQLAELGLVPEEWGGDTLMANISARNRIGIEELLELVLLQAEMLDLKAAYDRPARGRVVESRLDKGKGPVATVLIQEGTLREGDVFVSGQTFGRVRAMLDSLGQRVKEATPSTPVEILGFEDLPQAGDDFILVEDEEKARKVAEYRQRKAREAEAAKQTKISLEKLFEKLKEGELKDLKIVLKADTQGTLEALDASLQKLSTDKVKVTIIRKGIGAITESDVMLASASEAIVIGFNVKPTSQAKETAKQEGVDIRFYDVIYHLLEDIKKAMEGLLEPVYEEVITGVAEVRATFKVPKVGIVAGCYVKEGVISRNNKVRVIRDGVVVFTGGIASLKRFKEDVKEVQAGYECGLKIENFNDVKVGDIIEAFEVRKVEQKL
jgi:translation initiation factor IF-2